MLSFVFGMVIVNYVMEKTEPKCMMRLNILVNIISSIISLQLPSQNMTMLTINSFTIGINMPICMNLVTQVVWKSFPISMRTKANSIAVMGFNLGFIVAITVTYVYGQLFSNSTWYYIE